MLILTNAEKLEIGELSFKGYTKEYEENFYNYRRTLWGYACRKSCRKT